MSEHHNLNSLSYYERKEYEELKFADSDTYKKQRDRVVFLAFFAISLIATLLISGALKINLDVFAI